MQLKKPIGDGFWRGIDLLVMERSIRMTFKDVVLKIGSAVVYDLSAVRHLHREEQARVLRKRCPSSTPGASRYYAFIAFSPIPGFYRSSRKQTASRRGENERSGRKRIGLSPHLISPRCRSQSVKRESSLGLDPLIVMAIIS
jgi:hypothetical protein